MFKTGPPSLGDDFTTFVSKTGRHGPALIIPHLDGMRLIRLAWLWVYNMWYKPFTLYHHLREIILK